MARLNLSISEEVDNTLAILAKNLDRTKGYIVRNAIKHYLQEMREDIEDAEIALERIKDPNFKTYTTEEVRTLLAKNNV